jgi:hypothetical protein
MRVAQRFGEFHFPFGKQARELKRLRQFATDAGRLASALPLHSPVSALGQSKFVLIQLSCGGDMSVNLKRGLREGAAVAAICTGLAIVLFWRIRQENPFTSSRFSDIGLVAFATGILGFLVGTFRPPSARLKK